MTNSKTFRLFISSTFSDLKEERNILQAEVFPKIKKFAKSYGYNFEPIDLRWGVSNEAGLDHKAMEICINEVKKVFNYPKPNFLIMLGNRYGWIPVPTEIEEKYYNEIIHVALEEEIALFEKWFKKDENSIPAQYILQPINKILGKEHEKQWFDVEEKNLVNLIIKYQNIFPKHMKIGKSATEQEIIKGVLEPAGRVQGNENVLCMVRDIENIDDIEDPIFIEDDQSKLIDLKSKLQNCQSPNVEYIQLSARLVKKEDELKPDKDYLEDYAIAVKNFLVNNIKNEIQRLAQKSESIEDLTHEKFMFERAKVFIGREDILSKAIRYVEDDSKNVFVIFGESGVGKSAFMAKLIKTIDDQKSINKDILYRFVGISETSSQPKLFLDNLITKIAHKLDLEVKQSSKDYSESVNRFMSVLHEYSKKSTQKLLIIIDALDQFKTKTNLEWIEAELPHNIKIILSTLPSEHGEYYDILKTKVSKNGIHKLEKLDLDDGKSIISSWLTLNNKKLTDEQLKHLYNMFKKNGLPLYLKIIFDQALTWKSYDKTYKELDDKTLTESIRSFFHNLVFRQYHSKMLVEHTLGYISASKNGLSENEIVEILSSDYIVMQDISNPYHKLSSNTISNKLPAAVWSRLYYDLLKYLTFVEFDGISLISFYHRKIKECSRDYYYALNKEFYHTNLLEYFWNQPTVFEESKNVNIRKLSELPYHCIKSNSYSKFLELNNLSFINHKIKNEQLDNLLLEFYNISSNISNTDIIQDYKELYIKNLAINLLKYLIIYIKDPSDDLISSEDIHATFVYRSNKDFYKKFLEISCNLNELKALVKEADNIVLQKYHAAFSARYANLVRREAQLDEAAEIYNKLEKEGLVNTLDYFEQSRIYYDIGYIAYLSGKYDEAIDNMKKSADIANQEDSQVSRYISKCVGYRIQMLKYGMDQDFEDVLFEALEVFQANKFTNLGAKRWIKNVYAHLFEVGYEQKNVDKCEKYLDLLKSDDWMMHHPNVKKYSSFSPYEARLYILKKDFITACKIFSGYIYELIDDDKRDIEESIARDYYDYLVALKEVDMEKFSTEHQKALKLPDKPGNHLWKEKIENLTM